MLRITAAAKALLLAVFALLSLAAATGGSAAAPAAAPASVTGPEAAPPVAGQGSCSPPDSDTTAHPGQARRAQRPETGAPQAVVLAAHAPASPGEPSRHAVATDGGAPHSHAPSRSGDLPVALRVFRC
ncbi:hypothetical protein GCM10009730_25820 [Streptomyces albidochromogenes]|uniref:hypothetical protein n=1 Tax=Streptomyces albidochromogenes TaxID=329524 RepID=UPI002FE76816